MTIPSRLVVEYVGLEDAGQQAAFTTAALDILSRLPVLRSALDTPDARRLKRFEKVRKALDDLDAGDAVVLSRISPEGSVTRVVEPLREALDEAIADLRRGREWDDYHGDRAGRPTEAGRDAVVNELARLFHRHYALDPEDQRGNLADFLSGALDANGITHPADILALVTTP